MTKFRKPSARVLSAQHLAVLRVHQMRLCARKTGHLDFRYGSRQWDHQPSKPGRSRVNRSTPPVRTTEQSTGARRFSS
jgi:hypothetical protein